MKIPAGKLTYNLYKNNKQASDNDKAIYDILIASNTVNVSVNELVYIYMDNQAPVIIELLIEYGSQYEITSFINNTEGLIDNSTLKLLQRAIQSKLNENVGGYEINK